MKNIYLLSTTLVIFSIALIGCKQKKIFETQEVSPTMQTFSIQTPIPIDEIESWTQTKIPETAFDIQTHTQHWMDSAIYIKFSLPANELDIFLRDAGFEQLESNYWPFYDTPVPWWPKRNDFVNNPKKTFSGAKLNLMEQRFAKFIGVDMTKSDIYVIYLFCFDV